MIAGNKKTSRKVSKAANRRSFSALLLLVMLVAQALLMGAALAQTMPATPSGNQSAGNGGSQVSGQAANTQNTVPNPYIDAPGFIPAVNQSSGINVQGGSNQYGSTKGIDTNVNDLLRRDNPYGQAEQQPTTLVFQSAEQLKSNPQQDVNNIITNNLGSINDTYRGMHQFFNDDIVGNLFSQIGQLIGKWISELVNGWIADTVQFLASFLRVFVLNPNIAVNGLNGSKDDGISAYVRQGADVMYGIAVDLLLLLFILAIWKYWAEAAWRGGGNLMGAVGRLIFTAGLMLAFPTLYAFEIQITNEMIKAIYFNSSDQVMMLDAALASAVRGGILAGVGGLVNAFAPMLGAAAGGAIAGGVGGIAGGLVGEVFAFAGLVIFLILGGILIAELIYILVLKAIQTALLTAQYMFAPIFLVFFATPDTESVTSGFIRAWVETSLWTFVWVGLLKIMVIIMFSDYNPWGKILLAVGVLQMMIQVPTFLARAQISPMSDFISAGLITGGLLKGFGWMKNTLTSRAGQAINYFANDRVNQQGYQQAMTNKLNGVPNGPADPNKLNQLNSAVAKGQQPFTGNKPPGKGGPGQPGGPNGPGGPGGPGGPTPPNVKGAQQNKNQNPNAQQPPGKKGQQGQGLPGQQGQNPGQNPQTPGIKTPGGQQGQPGQQGTGTTTGGVPGTGTNAGGTPLTNTPKGKGVGLGAAAAMGVGAGAALAGAGANLTQNDPNKDKKDKVDPNDPTAQARNLVTGQAATGDPTKKPGDQNKNQTEVKKDGQQGVTTGPQLKTGEQDPNKQKDPKAEGEVAKGLQAQAQDAANKLKTGDKGAAAGGKDGKGAAGGGVTPPQGPNVKTPSTESTQQMGKADGTVEQGGHKTNLQAGGLNLNVGGKNADETKLNATGANNPELKGQEKTTDPTKLAAQNKDLAGAAAGKGQGQNANVTTPGAGVTVTPPTQTNVHTAHGTVVPGQNDTKVTTGSAQTATGQTQGKTDVQTQGNQPGVTPGAPNLAGAGVTTPAGKTTATTGATATTTTAGPGGQQVVQGPNGQQFVQAVNGQMIPVAPGQQILSAPNGQQFVQAANGQLVQVAPGQQTLQGPTGQAVVQGPNGPAQAPNGAQNAAFAAAMAAMGAHQYATGRGGAGNVGGGAAGGGNNGGYGGNNNNNNFGGPVGPGGGGGGAGGGGGGNFPPPNGPQFDNPADARLGTDYYNNRNLSVVDAMRGPVSNIKNLNKRVAEGQNSNFVKGSMRNGWTVAGFREGASDAERAHVIATAGFADLATSDDEANDAARQAALQSGAHKPQGMAQRMAAGVIAYQGGSWGSTALAKKNFANAMYTSAVDGSRAYVSGEKGNKYTEFLQSRYGAWTPDADTTMTWLFSNPDASESAWNPAIGPATDALVASGLPINASTRGAIQNPYIMTMRPGARKAAVRALLATVMTDDRMQGVDPGTQVGGVMLGEIARGMPQQVVESAMAMTAVNGGADTDMNLSNAQAVAQVSFATNTAPTAAYSAMISTVGSVVRGVTGNRTANVRTLDDARNVCMQQPDGEVLYQRVLQSTGSAVAGWRAQGVQITTLSDPGFASVNNWVESAAGYFDVTQPPNAQSVDRLHNAQQAAASVLGTFGMHGFSPERANASFQLVNDGVDPGRMSAQDIDVTARVVSAGYGQGPSQKLSYNLVQTARNLYPTPASPVDLNQLQNVAAQVDAGNARPDQAVPVMHVLNALGNAPGTVTRPIIELATSLTASPGGFNEDIFKVQANVVQKGWARSATEAQQMFTIAVADEADRHGLNVTHDVNSMISDLETHVQGFSVSQIGDRVEMIQSMANLQNFTGQQLTDRVVMSAAVDGLSAAQLGGNNQRVQSVQIAARVHGSNPAAFQDASGGPNNYVLDTYDQLQSTDVPIQQIDLRTFMAARSIMDANRNLAATGGKQIPLCANAIRSLIAQPAYNMGGATLQQAPQINDPSLLAFLQNIRP